MLPVDCDSHWPGGLPRATNFHLVAGHFQCIDSTFGTRTRESIVPPNRQGDPPYRYAVFSGYQGGTCRATSPSDGNQPLRTNKDEYLSGGPTIETECPVHEDR